jgi:hypothetical protein
MDVVLQKYTFPQERYKPGYNNLRKVANNRDTLASQKGFTGIHESRTH